MGRTRRRGERKGTQRGVLLGGVENAESRSVQRNAELTALGDIENAEARRGAKAMTVLLFL